MRCQCSLKLQLHLKLIYLDIYLYICTHTYTFLFAKVKFGAFHSFISMLDWTVIPVVLSVLFNFSIFSSYILFLELIYKCSFYIALYFFDILS